jgi:Fe-S-cluster-containing dehydrogenase component
MHCNDPSCVSACPVTAMKKDTKTGIVTYDKDACIGCRYCVAACPFSVPRFEYDSPTPKIVKCELCRHLKEGDKFQYSACAQVCPTGATLAGKSKDLMAEAKRRLALKPGSTTVYPRGKLGGANQSYEGPVGNYQQHVYGEKEYGGTQVYKIATIPLEKLGMPKLPDYSSASRSETIQHSLYGGLIMPVVVLGGLVAIAKRNVKHDDEE